MDAVQVTSHKGVIKLFYALSNVTERESVIYYAEVLKLMIIREVGFNMKYLCQTMI